MSIIAFILCKIKEFPESQKKKNDLVKQVLLQKSNLIFTKIYPTLSL